MIAAVTLVDVLNHFFAPLVLEVDIDIRRLFPLGGDEALKQQIVAVGIDLGDAEAVADRGIGRRAAALAENIFRTGEAHDVVNGEEIGRVLALRDQSELMFDSLPYFVGNAIRITLRGTFEGEMRKRLLRRGKAFDLLVRIFVFQFVKREGQRLAEARGFVNRLRRVAEQPRHFRWRFQEALGIGRKLPPRTVNGGLLTDAGQHVGKRAAVGMVEMHVVDRDQRHLAFARERPQAFQPGPIAPAIEHRGGQPHPVRRGLA